MENFIINIGLNVGYREPKIQLDSVLFHLKSAFPSGTENTLKEENNGSCWGKERILIVKGVTDLDAESLHKLIQNLCYLLSQQAMPFCLGEHSEVVYSKDYKGEIFLFREECFLRK
jgi:hypothetical protein